MMRSHNSKLLCWQASGLGQRGLVSNSILAGLPPFQGAFQGVSFVLGTTGLTSAVIVLALLLGELVGWAIAYWLSQRDRQRLIAEQQAVENILRRREAQHQAILTAIPDLMFRLSRESIPPEPMFVPSAGLSWIETRMRL